MKSTSLLFAILLFLSLYQLHAQTSLDEIITDMTLPHEGRPHGVPATFDWGLKPRVGAQQPPAGWNSAIAWGQLYEWIDGNPATNTRVQIKDLEMYYLSKTDHKWHLLQKSVGVDGNAYVEDFAGDVNKPADQRIEKDGSVSVKAGGGYNFHFWSKQGRVKYPQDDVAGCYVTVKARLVMDNASGTDDRAIAKYVMSVGGDWWQSLTAVWDQWKTNADMGISRFRFVTPEWKSFNMVTAPLDTVRTNPPPFTALSTTGNPLHYIKPGILKLEQNVPNPFTNTTMIRFSHTGTNKVLLSVFNENGTKVKTLINKTITEGDYTFQWNETELPSGSYFITLESNNSRVSRKCQMFR